MSYNVTLKINFQISVFKTMLNAHYKYGTILFRMEYIKAYLYEWYDILSFLQDFGVGTLIWQIVGYLFNKTVHRLLKTFYPWIDIIRYISIIACLNCSINTENDLNGLSTDLICAQRCERCLEIIENIFLVIVLWYCLKQIVHGWLFIHHHIPQLIWLHYKNR